MSKLLLEFTRGEALIVVTADGCIFEGLLSSYDQAANLLLSDCSKITRNEGAIKKEALGHFLIRGDALSFVGNMEGSNLNDETLRQLLAIAGHPLRPSSKALKRAAS